VCKYVVVDKNMELIDGKKISQLLKDELKLEIKNKNLHPGLAVVLVGDDSASQIYVKHKKKACEYVGIKSFSHILSKDVSEENLLELIEELNKDEKVHGILVQLPMPTHIDEKKILLSVDPEKDVDGFHPLNVGNLMSGKNTFVSCTPAGIIELLDRYKIDLAGKHAVVVGRSNIVGKPVSILLLQRNATVTICHSWTKDLASITRQADILVAAVGKANIISKDMLKPGSVVIDVGMNRLANGKLVGDVDYLNAKEIVRAITPVPGGVGPMTIAMLMKNCVKAAKNLS